MDSEWPDPGAGIPSLPLVHLRALLSLRGRLQSRSGSEFRRYAEL